MSKARTKSTPKPPQRQPLEAQASPELRSLMQVHDILTIGNWADALAIKNRHGHESEIATHVEKVWAQCNGGRKEAFRAAVSFPSRGYLDIAAKLAFLRADRTVDALEPARIGLDALIADTSRLANAIPPETADKELLDRVSECEAAMAVHRALWSQFEAERERATRIAEAAGYTEAKGHSGGGSWQARHDAIKEHEPVRSYERANEAHKEMGRTAKAVFAVKAQTIHGAIAKLRIVMALTNADELDTWQPVDRDWLAETLADFEQTECGEQE